LISDEHPEELRTEHLTELIIAKSKLSNPGFAISAINVVGRPIDDVIKKLPVKYQDKIN
jgi:hypothetical protein